MREVRELRIQITTADKYPRLYDPELLRKEKAELSQEKICAVVKAVSELGVTDIRLTGGDPLERGDLAEIITKIKEVEGIEKVYITTNGVFFKSKAEELKKAGLDGADFYLDSYFEEKYIYMMGGAQIEETMDSIECAVALELKPVRINSTIIKGLNDDEILTFAQMALNEPVGIVFIERPNGEGIKAIKSENELSFMAMEEIKAKFKGIIKIPSRDQLGEFFKWPEAMGSLGFVSLERGKNYGAELTADAWLRKGIMDEYPENISEAVKSCNVERIKEAFESVLK